MDLKNGKFVILTNYSDREKYFSLGRIKSIPINSLTSNTWIDIFYYSQRENIFSVNRKICHIRVGEIFCTVNSFEKIRKGVYKFIRTKEIKKINMGITNKYI